LFEMPIGTGETAQIMAVGRRVEFDQRIALLDRRIGAARDGCAGI
jgi:hypothetical protein